MTGEVNVFNLLAWNISISKFNINFCGWKAGHMEMVVVRSALVSGLSWSSLHTEPPSLLPWPLYARSQWIWKKLSDSHWTGHRVCWLWSIIFEAGQLCGNKSSYSAYSVRLTLIPPPRPPSHQLVCFFPRPWSAKTPLYVRGHLCDTAALKLTTYSWCWPTMKIYV